MLDKKLTDEAIVKGLDGADVFLRDLAGSTNTSLDEYAIGILFNIAYLCGDALALINRQKAEIDELQRRNSELDIELKAMRGAANSYKAEVDMVNHPSHYESGKYECIDVMLETQGKEDLMAFCLCNAFKYLYRHKNKNGIEDIKKAKWYLDKYIEMAEEDSDDSQC